MTRPYKLIWTDSCRHTRAFSTLDRAVLAAQEARPCCGTPCKWEIRKGCGPVLLSGLA